MTLQNVDSGRKYTKSECVYRGVKRTGLRLQQFSEIISTARHEKVRSTVYAGVGVYLVNIKWTQCRPCLVCVSQPVHLMFDPKKSSSFRKENCSSNLCLGLPFSNCNPFYGCVYVYEYGNGSAITSGFLGTETFTFEKVSVPKITFGCGLFNLGAGFTEGLIGLGRGPLSLISQLNETKFSYCLTSYGGTKPSTLLIGSQPSVISSCGTDHGKIKTTPLIQNPQIPTLYYVSLEGITIGCTRLPINKTTFALNPDGSGGLFIDSGTTITYLQLRAYRLVRKEFISQIKLPVVDAYNATGAEMGPTFSCMGIGLNIDQKIPHFLLTARDGMGDALKQ